jgi:ribonuclease HII
LPLSRREESETLARAVTLLEPVPDFVLTDGFPVRRMRVPCLSIKKGDQVAASVAAASIVAKVTRDRTMARYHRRFRRYGFDHNRGYGTREHWQALDRFGPSPIHRLSFKGVSPEGRVVVLDDPEDPSTIADTVVSPEGPSGLGTESG